MLDPADDNQCKAECTLPSNVPVNSIKVVFIKLFKANCISLKNPMLPIKQPLRRQQDLQPIMKMTELQAANAAAAAAGASGRPSAMSVPNISAGPGSGTPGVFNSAPPGPKDTVAPASPPAPATAGTGGQVLAAPAAVQLTLPIVRSPRQQDQLNGFANNPVTPQDMARDF